MWSQNTLNKRFKTDSQRSAVLVLFGLYGYGAIVECRGSVAHHLSGRYVLYPILRFNSLFSQAICSGFSASQHWLSKFLDLSANCANQVSWFASLSFLAGTLLVLLAQIVASFSIFETDVFVEIPL